MNPGISVLERAFQFAVTGRYDTVTHIKRRLDSKGYATLLVSGPTLFKQLMAEIVSERRPTASRTAARGPAQAKVPGLSRRRKFSAPEGGSWEVTRPGARSAPGFSPHHNDDCTGATRSSAP